MRDEEIGKPLFPLQSPEQIDNAGLNGDIQGGDDFIAQDQLGRCRERASNCHALTFTTAQLPRLTFEIDRIQLDRR